MEWVVVLLVVVVALVLFGRTGSTSPRAGSHDTSSSAPPASTQGRPSARHAAAAAGPVVVADEVLRRAVDPNDPDGAFMDGYVSGRYTERWSARETDRTPDEPRRDLLPDEDDDLVDVGSSGGDDFGHARGASGGHGSYDSDVGHGSGWGDVDDWDDSDDW